MPLTPDPAVLALANGGDTTNTPLPNTPLVQTPANMQPTQPATPAATAPENYGYTPSPTASAPGSFSDKFHSAITSPEGTALASVPGGFMRAVLASAVEAMRPSTPTAPNAGQRVRHAIDSFFAPMAGASGAIGGAGNAAARNLQMQDAEQRQKFEQQQAVSKEQREKLEFGLQVATANANMLHSQLLIHKLGVDEMNANIADSQKALETFKAQHIPPNILGTDLTSDDIKRGVQQHTADPTKGIDLSASTPFLTGKVQVGTDENGNPQYRGTYTLAQLPKQVSITDAEEAKGLFPTLQGLDRVDAEHPLVVSGADYNAAFQVRETTQAATASAQKAADEAAIASGERAEKIEAMNFAGANIFAQDMATFARQNPKASHAEIVIGAYQMLQATPPTDPKTGQRLYPHIEQDIAARLGEKNFNDIQKEAETSRHDRQVETQKAREDAFKEAKDNAPVINSNKNGEEFIATLPAAEQGLVKGVIEGRLTLSPRQLQSKDGRQIVAEVMQAYPDFDISKAPAYGKARLDYTSGKTAVALNAYGTALEHLKELYDVAGAGSFIPGTQEYTKFQNTLTLYAPEIQKALNGGTAPTQGEIEDLKKTLSGLRRQTGIQQQAKLLSEKLDNYQQQWDNASPSSALRPPMPGVSQAARDAVEYVRTGGKAQPSQPQVKLPAAPQGQVAVQIPGSPVGFIPRAALDKFKQDHPNAVIGQ